VEEWQWKGFDDFPTCPYNAEGHLSVKSSSDARAKGGRPFVLIEMATYSKKRMAIMLGGRNCLGLPSGQALSPIIWNGAIDDRSAVDALPGI